MKDYNLNAGIANMLVTEVSLVDWHNYSDTEKSVNRVEEDWNMALWQRKNRDSLTTLGHRSWGSKGTVIFFLI